MLKILGCRKNTISRSSRKCRFRFRKFKKTYGMGKRFSKKSFFGSIDCLHKKRAT